MRRTRQIVVAVVLAGLSAACATEGDSDVVASFSSRTTLENTPSDDRTTGEAETDDTETTATTGAETTTTAPPTTAPPPPGFDGGMQVVGTDVQPGRYTTEVSGYCYWERLSGLTGDFDEIIVNANPEGQAIVEIEASDVAFSSDGCDRWTDYEPPAAPVTEFGSGDWVVGEQIAPGTYQAEGEFCYWERASGFTHNFGEILANDFSSDRAVVEIAPGDVRFTNNGCGTWTPL